MQSTWIENYLVPGTEVTIDRYNPDIPRTAILFEKDLDLLHVRIESIRESFGNNILIFVLFQGDVAGNIWEDEPSIEITKISAGEDVDNVLSRLAEEINARRTHTRSTYKLYGASEEALGACVGGTAPRRPLGGAAGGVLGAVAGMAVPLLMEASLTKRCTHKKEFKEEVVKTLDALTSGWSSRRRKRPRTNLKTVAGLEDQIYAIKVTLSRLLRDESFNTVNEEVNRLVVEFSAKHYTACALRAGRCLEAVVYVVARDWEVPVDEPTLACLDAIDGDALKLRKLIIDYDPESVRGEQKRNRICDTAGNINKHCMHLLTELNDLKNGTNGKDPDRKATRNVPAILRDIHRKYGRPEQIRKNLDAISPLVQSILTVRNDAAHADPYGKQREVGDEEVKKMVNEIVIVLQRLTNIGDIIKSGGVCGADS